MTAVACDTVPLSLCEALLIAALQNDRDRAVEQVVARWPWQHLFLRNCVPPMFSPRPHGFHRIYLSYGDELGMCEHMRRGVKQTTCLAHTFIECLKRHTETKLRYLDLTGYPSGELVVLCITYIVSLCFQCRLFFYK